MKSTKQAELVRATRIQQSLGVRVAAGYLRNRGWSFDSALWHLLCVPARNWCNDWYKGNSHEILIDFD